jgi:hypothetical protein
MKKQQVMTYKKLLVGLVLSASLFCTAEAGVIISASKASVNYGGGTWQESGYIEDTYNQAGLYDKYISGVTDFDSYIASSPFHTSDYNSYEWFSVLGNGSAPMAASVTYYLGGPTKIDGLALWNEESAGIAILDLFGSSDGVNFFSLASDLRPRDNPFDVNAPNADYRYSPEVFSFTDTNLQYVRFDMSGCPDDNQPVEYQFCSIGEVAFRASDVPEPGSIILLSVGLMGMGYRMKKNKSQF